MKGRPPKPAALRALDGGASHRPDDDRHALTLPPGTPEPPGHLAVGARQEWFRIVSYLQQVKGLLSPGDAAAIGIYCSYYEQWQQAEETLPILRRRLEEAEDQLERKMSAKLRAAHEKSAGRLRNRYNLATGERNKARKEMRAYLAELGLTPAARARIRVPNGQTELPLDGGDPLAAARANLSGA